MSQKKKVKVLVDPDYQSRQKAALVRRHRQVLYFNDNELAAVDAYCRKFKIRSKSSLLREIVMEKIISELEDNHPTLF